MNARDQFQVEFDNLVNQHHGNVQLAIDVMQRFINQQIANLSEQIQIASSESQQINAETDYLRDHNSEPRLFRSIKYSAKKHGVTTKTFFEENPSSEPQGIAHDFHSGKKYHFSNVTTELRNEGDEDDGDNLLHTDHTGSIALAVIAGRHFHRMLGDSHCKFYLAVSESTTDMQYYRLGEDVKGFIFWENFKKLDSTKPVYGFFLIFVLAYYFGDFDAPLNIGFIEADNHYKVSKIDPEHCYGSFYVSETEKNVVKHLKFFFESSMHFDETRIAELQKREYPPNHEDVKILEIYGMALQQQSLEFAFLAFNSAPFMTELFQKIYFSPQRNQELFVALAIILETGLDALKEDIDAVLGPDDSPFKQKILQANQNRYQLFKEAAFMLEGFPRYFFTKAYEQDPIYQVYKGQEVQNRPGLRG